MLTISKPLSAGQANRYHREAFRNARENYYTAGDEIRGTFHGQLAARWGLHGDVHDDQFRRLADGQHPLTGEPLVHHQTAHRTVNRQGETVHTMEHRAGWDLTFSAPKTVSLTALVGADTRVRDAHAASVVVALDETERYVQARHGGNRPAETTGNWIAALFEHDSARPVDGYAAPQLHTHAVVFNLTQTETGDIRPVQPRELFRTQQYATAVYRSELAARLTALGYPIERGPSHQPEIGGYSAEYVEASSPRRRQIEAHLAAAGHRGAEAAEIAAHRTRESKLNVTDQDMPRRHRELAETFGHQPSRIVELARHHAKNPDHPPHRTTPQVAVTFAKDRNFERESVVDERILLRDALVRSMGDLTLDEIKKDFGQRVQAREFISIAECARSSGRAFTTRELMHLERETIQRMRDGQCRHASLVRPEIARAVIQDASHLNPSQRAAVQQIVASRDQIIALEGVAGTGKTTALAAVREAAVRDAYLVEGFAPTSRAAQALAKAGIVTSTLQRHLMQRQQPAVGQKRLYVLDESSLAGTRQMHTFLHRLSAEDRVLLVGDIRQHLAVEAGRPYQQLQEAGIQTARLDHIVRQPDPALKAVVEHLARGEVREAVQHLDRQGRIHEIPDRDARLDTIAREYASHPESTLVVSPDHRSREEINQRIHQALQAAAVVDRDEHRVRVLVARQDVTGADRQWAQRYDIGDLARYSAGSKTYRLSPNEYARVEQVHAAQNLLTVRRTSGRAVTYDPRRLQGVTLYREAERAFARGDRVQMTAPDRTRHLANRELGTIERIDASDVSIRLDSGRTVAFNLDQLAHLDYGYAVTSHSSQGQTADRVLVHVDTEQGEVLVNRRLAYVAISRGRYDVQLYANDKSRLADTLSREVLHRAALEPSRSLELPARSVERSWSDS